LENVLSGNTSKQINITDDYVGYEIGRYLQLLSTQNPNIIELVHADEQHIEYCHPLFQNIIIANRDSFLDRRVAFSFGEYARSQIKKAQGTNKKFLNPMDKERKTLMDFCWVGEGQGSISLKDFIARHLQSRYVPDWMFGCTAIEHMKNCYHLFFDNESYKFFMENDDEMLRDYLYAHRKYQGVIDKDGVQIRLSSVEKGVEPVITFYCNLEGFQKYCKDYKEYWEWIEKSNKQRFVENAANEHNYDRKNMMHCHRLLDMCIEILRGEGVKVFRPNRADLLSIRNGNFTYGELVNKAEEKYTLIQELYKSTNLPQKCDQKLMSGILLNLRKSFYGIEI
jgi:predicted nucleotidyltransferase